MGGCTFGLRSQFSAEPGPSPDNEQATDTLPCASPAMARICCRRGSCASADTAERVRSSARRIWVSIGNPEHLRELRRRVSSERSRRRTPPCRKEREKDRALRYFALEKG